MIAVFVFAFLGAVCIPMGVSWRARYRDGALRSERFLQTVTTTLIKAASGVTRMRVKVVPSDEASPPTTYRITVVEAMIEDHWVPCFCRWHGRVLVEDGGRRRARLELKHVLLLADAEESDWQIVQQLSAELLAAASKRALRLREAPWVYARRWRTRECEVGIGDTLWILGGVEVSESPAAAATYRDVGTARAWKIVSRMGEGAHPRRELLIAKTRDFDDAMRLIGLEGQGRFFGSLLFAVGLASAVVSFFLLAAYVPGSHGGPRRDSTESSPSDFAPGPFYPG
jgi:hypothetical protein